MYWKSDKDARDLNEFKKVIRKEVGKVLKSVKEYVKASAREDNKSIKCDVDYNNNYNEYTN